MRGYEKEGFTQRQIANRLKKELEKEESEKNQKHVKKMTVTIEWKKSPTWGFCPKAEASIYFEDGSFGKVQGYKASGCGYDKESTVFASICNDVLKYSLWNVTEEARKKAPYGVRFNDEYNHYFEGGVGMSCYYNIAEFLGGKLEHTANGKTFDVYTIEF